MEAKQELVGDYFAKLQVKLGYGEVGKRDDLLALCRVARISDENARLKSLIRSLLELIDKHSELPLSASNGQELYLADPPIIWIKDCGVHSASTVMANARSVAGMSPGRESSNYRTKYEWKQPPASPAPRTAPPRGDGEMGD